MQEIQVEKKSQTYETIWSVLQGLQILLACIGATVLGPIIMGIEPNMAILTSGIGTVMFVLVTRTPAFLGTSFAFISAITYVMANGSREEVGGGIILAGLLSVAVGLIARRNRDIVEKIIPPVVANNLLVAIGAVLVGIAWNGIQSDPVLAAATIAMLLVFGLAFKQSSLVTGLPLFLAMIVMYGVALALGQVDTESFASAPLFAELNLFVPKFSWLSFTIVGAAVATLTEVYADAEATGAIFDEDLKPKIWLIWIMDGLADIVSFVGNPSTWYNEGVGVLRLAKNQRPDLPMSRFLVPSLIAGVVAIVVGLLGITTPFVSSIPGAVVNALFLVVLGIIMVLGPYMFKNKGVDFTQPENYLITWLMSFVWLSGAFGSAYEFIGVSLGPITACAVLGILAYQIRRWGSFAPLAVLLVAFVWTLTDGIDIGHGGLFLVLSGLVPVVYYAMNRLDLGNRYVQLPLAIIMPVVIALILQI